MIRKSNSWLFWHRYEASRKTLYCTFLNTVFATALRPSVIITCVAGLWAWGVYVLRSMVSDETLVYIDNDRHSDSSFGDSVVVQFDNDTAEESIAYFLQNLDRMAGLTALVQVCGMVSRICFCPLWQVKGDQETQQREVKRPRDQGSQFVLRRPAHCVPV